MTEIFSCSRIKPVLSAYLDGELSEEEKEIIEAHIEHCSDCKTELENLCELSFCLKSCAESSVIEADTINIVSARLDECNSIKEDLSAFIDNELPKSRTKEVCEHLLQCQYCRKDWENLKITGNLLKEYFVKSSEKAKMSDLTRKRVLNKVSVYHKRKKIIYSVAVLAILALATYFSLNIFTSPENIHEVKYTPEPASVEIQNEMPIPEKP